MESAGGGKRVSTRRTTVSRKKNREDKDVPSRAVKYQNADITFLPRRCLSIVARGRGAFTQRRPRPSLQPADRPVDAVNQAKTSCGGKRRAVHQRNADLLIYSHLDQQNKTQQATSGGEFFSPSALEEAKLHNRKKTFSSLPQTFRYHIYKFQ